MSSKMPKQVDGLAVCKSCGQPVTVEDTELMGGNLLYWKVYRCKKCLKRRRLWTFAVCVFILAALAIGFALSF
jgi:hypothetical protein